MFKVTPALLRRADFFALMLLAFLLGVGVGIASDVGFIVLTRKILRWGTGAASFFAISAMVLLNLLLALILAFGPAGLGFGVSWIVFGFHNYERQYPAGPLSLSIFVAGLQQIGYIASLSNAITALLACVFVLLAIAALVHRLFWSLLERPIYALQRFGIARRSKLMGNLGVAFCGLGLGVAPSWLKVVAPSWLKVIVEKLI